MGQRSSPIALRLGINRAHDARWFADTKTEYAQQLADDIKLRKLLEKRFKQAGISRIIIARGMYIDVTIHVANVGMIIGKKGATIDALKQELDRMFKTDVRINVKEVQNPDADAQVVAQFLATKMEQRGAFKTHVKKAISAAMRAGAKGIKVFLTGRLGGAEIARDEEFHEGSVPLQRLNAHIGYGVATAHTTSGTCGVKVWIYTHDNRVFNPFEGLHDKISQSHSYSVQRQSRDNS